MPSRLLEKLRTFIEGDPGVRKVADDPVLSAELLLLFRMILADGSVSNSEMTTFRRICTDAFGIAPESVDAVIEYLNDIGYETTGPQALAMFEDLDVGRRRLLVRHMAEIAKADAQIGAQEVKLLRRTLELLGLEPTDVAAHRQG